MKKLIIVIMVLIVLIGIIYYYIFKPDSASSSSDQNSGRGDLEKLKSLPYLTLSSEPADSKLNRVTIYNREKASDGYGRQSSS